MYPKKYLQRITSVLMLDSEKKLLEAIKTYFIIKDIHITTTDQIDVALSILDKNLPDCIVIDIAMPNNAGLHFINKLKTDKEFQHIPFILLTTKGLTEDRIKGYSLGCSAYILKPFDPEELEAIIKSLVSKKNSFYDFILDTYVLIKDIRLNLLGGYNGSISDISDLYLTDKEQYILYHILDGKHPSEIAFNSKVSIRYIEKYISRILNKTKTTTIKELKNFACLFL